MLLGDVVDQLHDEHGLAHACAAEEADLSALGVGSDQVHDLDARFKHLRGALLLVVGRRVAVDAPLLAGDGLGLIVDGLAQEVEHPSQGLLADRHLDAGAGVHSLHAANHTVGGAHGDAAHHVVAQLLGHFADQLVILTFDFNGVEQIRQMPVLEADVQNRADDLHNMADIFFLHTDFSFTTPPRRRRFR